MARAAILALALVLIPAVALAEISGPARVIGGDTIEVAGERIRLYSIDAPEAKQTCVTRGKRWPCGQRAASALADKIGQWHVRCQQRDTDRYKRVIATCFLGEEDLNGWLVRNGWAVAYRRYSLDYTDEEHEARTARAGVWASAFVRPWNWRRGDRLNIPTVAPAQPSTAPAITVQPKTQACCKICRKDKACGNSCIAAWKTCYKGPGCACNAY